MTRVVVPGRFNGPPGSGNGGYTAGLVAACLGGVVEVTLVAPPPLDTPLDVERTADGVSAQAGGRVIATARPATLDLEPPRPPAPADVDAMSRHWWGHEQHAFPTCFTCGPAREPGDGLRIFAGRRPEDALVAAPWVVDASLAEANGRVPAAVVWAAIDCPGYFAVARPGDVAVLGRMTADVAAVPRVGEHCTVVGWRLGVEGRKWFSATALWGGDGRLLAQARQVWIEVPPRSPDAE